MPGREHEAKGKMNSANDSRHPLLDVRNLQKLFPLAKKAPWSRSQGTVRAVDGISFTLEEKTTIGIVGESGCGKTTTGRMILDLDRPTSGEILFRGQRIDKLKGAERKRYRTSVQAVFQDATTSLNPRRRVRANIAEPLKVHEHLSKSAITQRVDELLDVVGLDTAVGDSFAHELSGGMRQRVAVARSLALNPSLIVLDEPVSALDVSIGAQVMNLLSDLQQEHGLSYVLIAHNLATVRYLSHKVAVLYLGQIVEMADAETIFTDGLHPYSLALISAAESSVDRRGRGRIVLGGEVASPANPPRGCRFHPRCFLRTQLGDPARCVEEVPDLRSVGEGHVVSCHFAEEMINPTNRRAFTEAARDQDQPVLESGSRLVSAETMNAAQREVNS
jgi:oligopeptide transport system ATP-binding protein